MQRVWSTYLGFIPTIHSSSRSTSLNPARLDPVCEKPLRVIQTDPLVLGALIFFLPYFCQMKSLV